MEPPTSNYSPSPSPPPSFPSTPPPIPQTVFSSSPTASPLSSPRSPRSPRRPPLSHITASPRPSSPGRIKMLIAEDPLLSHLTPAMLSRMSTDDAVKFSPGEREVGVWAATARSKIEDWAAEVENWENQCGWVKTNGDGFKVPSDDQSRKRRKLELKEKIIMAKSGPPSPPVSRKLFANIPPMPQSPKSPKTPTTPTRPPKLKTSNLNGNGNSNNNATNNTIEDLLSPTSTPLPMTKRLDLSLGASSSRHGHLPGESPDSGGQRRRSIQIGSLSGMHGTPTPTPSKRTTLDFSSLGSRKTTSPVGSFQPVTPVAEVFDDDEDEDDDEADNGSDANTFYGSITGAVVDHYTARIESITSSLQQLDVEALKSRVLSYRTNSSGFQLTDSEAMITATVLQLLPPLHKLSFLLESWSNRLEVCRVVPTLLSSYDDAEYVIFSKGNDWLADYDEPDKEYSTAAAQELDDAFDKMKDAVEQRVLIAGRVVDGMLDMLDGKEEIIPDEWIDRIEKLEEGLADWVLDQETRVWELKRTWRERKEHRLLEERLERERIERERLEKERLEREERERIERERLEQERLEQERLEQERLERERIEQERLEQERLEQERLEQERLEQERLEKERLEQERLEQERLEQERLEQEHLEQERLEQERLEQERLEQERLEQERIENERLENERIEQQRLEEERLERERIENERIEQERMEQERLERERAEAEERERSLVNSIPTIQLPPSEAGDSSFDSETISTDAAAFDLPEGSVTDVGDDSFVAENHSEGGWRSATSMAAGAMGAVAAASFVPAGVAGTVAAAGTAAAAGTVVAAASIPVGLIGTVAAAGIAAAGYASRSTVKDVEDISPEDIALPRARDMDGASDITEMGPEIVIDRDDLEDETPREELPETAYSEIYMDDESEYSFDNMVNVLKDEDASVNAPEEVDTTDLPTPVQRPILLEETTIDEAPLVLDETTVNDIAPVETQPPKEASPVIAEESMLVLDEAVAPPEVTTPPLEESKPEERTVTPENAPIDLEETPAGSIVPVDSPFVPEVDENVTQEVPIAPEDVPIISKDDEETVEEAQEAAPLDAEPSPIDSPVLAEGESISTPDEFVVVPAERSSLEQSAVEIEAGQSQEPFSPADVDNALSKAMNALTPEDTVQDKTTADEALDEVLDIGKDEVVEREGSATASFIEETPAAVDFNQSFADTSIYKDDDDADHSVLVHQIPTADDEEDGTLDIDGDISMLETSRDAALLKNNEEMEQAVADIGDMLPADLLTERSSLEGASMDGSAVSRVEETAQGISASLTPIIPPVEIPLRDVDNDRLRAADDETGLKNEPLNLITPDTPAAPTVNENSPRMAISSHIPVAPDTPSVHELATPIEPIATPASGIAMAAAAAKAASIVTPVTPAAFDASDIPDTPDVDDSDRVSLSEYNRRLSIGSFLPSPLATRSTFADAERQDLLSTSFLTPHTTDAFPNRPSDDEDSSVSPVSPVSSEFDTKPTTKPAVVRQSSRPVSPIEDDDLSLPESTSLQFPFEDGEFFNRVGDAKKAKKLDTRQELSPSPDFLSEALTKALSKRPSGSKPYHSRIPSAPSSTSAAAAAVVAKYSGIPKPPSSSSAIPRFTGSRDEILARNTRKHTRNTQSTDDISSERRNGASRMTAFSHVKTSSIPRLNTVVSREELKSPITTMEKLPLKTMTTTTDEDGDDAQDPNILSSPGGTLRRKKGTIGEKRTLSGDTYKSPTASAVDSPTTPVRRRKAPQDQQQQQQPQQTSNWVVSPTSPNPSYPSSPDLDAHEVHSLRRKPRMLGKPKVILPESTPTTSPTSTVSPVLSSPDKLGAKTFNITPPKPEPKPEFSLDQKINSILTSLPASAKVKLTPSPMKPKPSFQKREGAVSPAFPSKSSKPTPLRSHIPGPRGAAANNVAEKADDNASASSARRQHIGSEIKMYHLHRPNGEAPVKLFIRLVGEGGERVMVRVGGGWADLGAYLREYAAHHGSQHRMNTADAKIEVGDIIPGRSLRHSTSNGSIRSVSSLSYRRSPTPGGSRPTSPLPPSAAGHGVRATPPSGRLGGSESPVYFTSQSLSANRRGEGDSPSFSNARASPLLRGKLASPTTPTLTSPVDNVSPGSGSLGRPSSRSSLNLTPGAYSNYRLPASRLSYGGESPSSRLDSGDVSLSPASPPTPLGLAGPKSRKVEISAEKQAWVDRLEGQVRKVSAERSARFLQHAGSNTSMRSDLEGTLDGSDGSVVSGNGTGTGAAGGDRRKSREIRDMGRVGGTRRVTMANSRPNYGVLQSSKLRREDSRSKGSLQ